MSLSSLIDGLFPPSEHVHDFLVSRFDAREKYIRIDKMYYKKSGKSRTVVAINGNMDISALLSEYPLTFACGRKKTGQRAKIIMTVDWSLAKGHDGKCAADRSLFMSVYVDSLHQSLDLLDTRGCEFSF